MANKCKYCQTTFEEVLESGFVGCKNCYEELDELKDAIDKLYHGKKHRERWAGRLEDGQD